MGGERGGLGVCSTYFEVIIFGEPAAKSTEKTCEGEKGHEAAHVHAPRRRRGGSRGSRSRVCLGEEGDSTSRSAVVSNESSMALATVPHASRPRWLFSGDHATVPDRLACRRGRERGRGGSETPVSPEGRRSDFTEAGEGRDTISPGEERVAAVGSLCPPRHSRCSTQASPPLALEPWGDDMRCPQSPPPWEGVRGGGADKARGNALHSSSSRHAPHAVSSPGQPHTDRWGAARGAPNLPFLTALAPSPPFRVSPASELAPFPPSSTNRLGHAYGS